MQHNAVSSIADVGSAIMRGTHINLCTLMHVYLLIPSNRVKSVAPQGKLAIFRDPHKVLWCTASD